MASGKRDLTGWSFTAGRLSLDFLGTVGYRASDKVERLTDPAALRQWLADAGLPAPRRLTADDLSRARAVREALHGLLSARLDRLPPTPSSAALLNGAVALAPPVPVVRRERVEWRPVTSIDAPLSQIVRDGLHLITTGQIMHVRRCAANDCRKLFLDTAPRPRRWCSARICGNRNRVAAHRARTQPGE